MKLTKDEARILGETLAEAKYELIEFRADDGVFEKKCGKTILIILLEHTIGRKDNSLSTQE